MTIICIMERDTSPLHRVDQAVYSGLWNVVPLLFNGCAKFLDIGGNWNTISFTSIQSIPNIQAMEELGHFQLCFRTCNSLAIALVHSPAVSMPIARSLDTWDIYGIMLCDKTANNIKCCLLLVPAQSGPVWSCCLISFLICHTCQEDGLSYQRRNAH